MLDRTDRVGRPTRLLDELEILLRLARESGSYENGELLVEAYLFEERKAPRKGARPSWYVRSVLRKAVEGRGCPQGVQSAFLDRLNKGLKESHGSYTHSDEKEARLLLPLVGSFRNPTSRALLERLVESEQEELAVAGAEALAELRSGASLPALAKLLGRLDDTADIGRVAGSILEVIRAKAPPPEERDLKYTLDVALTQLKERADWRARLALMPVVRSIRGVASVPVLIGLLEEAAEKRDEDAFSGTLRTAIQEALVDLTGFYAPAYEPEKWRSFWEQEKDGFQIAPVREAPKNQGGTVSKGFFGIPVTGSRVIFVLDVSGSMREPASGASVSRLPGDKPSGGYLTKLARAKKELLRAVDGLAPDARFNVIFFESRVRPWQKRLVDASDRNKKRLEQAIAKLRPEGGTALYGGLNAGLEIQTRRSRRSRYASSVDEVFLLSDGIPSPGLSEIWEPEQIVERVSKWNAGARVRIHTVFLRTVVPAGAQVAPGAMGALQRAEKMMRDLAEGNGGKFAVF